MKGSEWPLVFFTLLVQAAVGLFITLAGMQYFIFGNSLLPHSTILVILIMLVTASIISVLHLGKIKNAIFTVSNVSNSWLSREILFLLLFTALTAVYLFLNRFNIFPEVLQELIYWAALFCGVLLIYFMSRIYMLQSIPAWNTFFTPAGFYLSALILGGAAFLIIVHDGIRTIMIIISVMLLLELVLILLNTFKLSHGARGAADSFGIIYYKHKKVFLIRIILNAAAAIGMLYISYGHRFSSELLIVFLIIIVISEITGRYLFYAGYVKSGI